MNREAVRPTEGDLRKTAERHAWRVIEYHPFHLSEQRNDYESM